MTRLLPARPDLVWTGTLKRFLIITGAVQAGAVARRRSATHVSAAAGNFGNDSHAHHLSSGFPEIQGLSRHLESLCLERLDLHPCQGCGDALPGQLRGLQTQMGQTVGRGGGDEGDRVGQEGISWDTGLPVLKLRKSWTNQDEMSQLPIPGEPREWKVVFFFAPSGRAYKNVTNEVFTGKSPRTIGLEEQAPAVEGR